MASICGGCGNELPCDNCNIISACRVCTMPKKRGMLVDGICGCCWEDLIQPPVVSIEGNNSSDPYEEYGFDHAWELQ